MNTKILATLLLSIVLTIFSIKSAEAQDQKTMGITLGTGFGSEITTFGFQGGVFYHLREDIRVAADYTYFMPKKDNFLGILLQEDWMEVNANGQFGYIPDDGVFLYSLAGLNYTFTRLINDRGEFKESGFGVNAGVGMDFRRSFIGFYGEIKYVILQDQLSGFIGTRLYF
jgi:hypothetical protein